MFRSQVFFSQFKFLEIELCIFLQKCIRYLYSETPIIFRWVVSLEFVFVIEVSPLVDLSSVKPRLKLLRNLSKEAKQMKGLPLPRISKVQRSEKLVLLYRALCVGPNRKSTSDITKNGVHTHMKNAAVRLNVIANLLLIFNTAFSLLDKFMHFMRFHINS